jgi:hypothetical protein
VAEVPVSDDMHDIVLRSNSPTRSVAAANL